MKIAIHNRQRLRRVDRARIAGLVRFLFARAHRLDPLSIWRELSIVFTDDAGIAPVAGRFFGEARPTDVIAFRYTPNPGDEPGPDGELVINVECAARVGPRYGGTARECALYLAHGCDHLMGGRDATPEERRRMRRRELRWLRQARERGLLQGLVGSAAGSIARTEEA